MAAGTPGRRKGFPAGKRERSEMPPDLTLDELNAAFPETGETMPVVFVGHGNPMNAIEDNVYSRAWIGAGKALPRPRAILSISAHWETKGSRVTAMERPRTLYTFDGFPEELSRAKYPAPGSPQLAALVQQTLKSKGSTGRTGSGASTTGRGRCFAACSRRPTSPSSS